MFASIRRRKMMKRVATKPSMGLLLVGSMVMNFILFWYILWGANQRQITSHSLKWHGGHPLDSQSGSCYCNSATYCLCTPSLAIDLVILSGATNSVWLVRRKDTDQLATMGGFVQVGESVETAVQRELMEEMGIKLNEPPVLFGVYSDPRRDSRRHTVSATYAVRVQEDIQPVAADDAKEVVLLSLDDIEHHSFFADHKTILTDFRRYVYKEQGLMDFQVGDFAEDVVRSVCGTHDAMLGMVKRF